MTYANPSSADPLCNVCHEPAEGHLRCAECGILIGPGHAVTALVDGARCFTCRRAQDRWEAAEARMTQREQGARERRYQAMQWQGGGRHG